MAGQCDQPASVGTGRGQRPKTRVLVRWNDETDVRLLLMVETVCKQKGIKIPWDDVAAALGTKFSGGAITQHLVKLRQKLLKSDRDVRRNGGKAADATVLPLDRGRSHIMDDDDDDDQPSVSKKHGRTSVDDMSDSVSSDDGKKWDAKKRKIETSKTKCEAAMMSKGRSNFPGKKAPHSGDNYSPPSKRTRGVKKDYRRMTSEDETETEEMNGEVTDKKVKQETQTPEPIIEKDNTKGIEDTELDSVESKVRKVCDCKLEKWDRSKDSPLDFEKGTLVVRLRIPALKASTQSAVKVSEREMGHSGDFAEQVNEVNEDPSPGIGSHSAGLTNSFTPFYDTPDPLYYGAEAIEAPNPFLLSDNFVHRNASGYQGSNHKVMVEWYGSQNTTSMAPPAVTPRHHSLISSSGQLIGDGTTFGTTASFDSGPQTPHENMSTVTEQPIIGGWLGGLNPATFAGHQFENHDAMYGPYFDESLLPAYNNEDGDALYKTGEPPTEKTPSDRGSQDEVD